MKNVAWSVSLLLGASLLSVIHTTAAVDGSLYDRQSPADINTGNSVPAYGLITTNDRIINSILLC